MLLDLLLTVVLPRMRAMDRDMIELADVLLDRLVPLGDLRRYVTAVYNTSCTC